MHSLARSIALGLLLAASATQAAPWSYRGTLNDSGVPANGRYDIRLSLLDASGAKSLAYPLTFSGVEVKNGAFAIDVDFGTDLTRFGALKLRTEVAQGGSGFVALGEPKAFDAKAALGSVCWDTQGNSGTNPSTDFLGTTDSAALKLRVNNRAFGTISDGANGVNMLLGSPANAALGGAQGAVVLGGSFGDGNSVTENFGVVSGGVGNRAAGSAAVAGGAYNYAEYRSFAVGAFNCAGGFNSFAGGVLAKVRPSNTATNLSSTCTGFAASTDPLGDEGTFMWADSEGGNFVSSGPNQFLVRADGGMAINTSKLGNHPNLRLADLTIRNSTGNANVDLNLMTTNARGYSLAVIPDGAAGAGSFYVQELNAISTGEPTWTPRLIITPGGQTQVQGGAVGTISDVRLKKNIDGIAHPLDTFLALRGHRFEYADPARALGATGTRMGFVAQEVKDVLPQWVSENGEGYYSVAPSGFEALAVEAVREQQQHINALQSENRALHDVVRGLSERLAALEAAKEQ
jgi:hypothetical protein